MQYQVMSYTERIVSLRSTCETQTELRPGGKTYTTTCSNGDLDAIAAGLADVFQVKRFVWRLVLATLYGQWAVVDADSDGRRPVRVHVLVLMVEALEL